MQRINVTKSYLPPMDRYMDYVRGIWERVHLTNQGPLVLELESALKQYLQVPELHFLTNGTLALQLALRASDVLGGEVITTPFSYVATTSSILWEQCTPVFVDIEPDTFCIDPAKIEAAITPKTKAIMPVHVFGFPCDIEAIEAIAQKHQLTVIYDAAHAFGVTYKGKGIFGYGDMSMGSFHATKLFHTIEGGCLATNSKELSEKIELLKRFGHNNDDHYMLGMNAKASEFQAAMGLSVLPDVPKLIAERKEITDTYDVLLKDSFALIKRNNPDVGYNYAYYPLVLDSEAQLQEVRGKLAKIHVFPRRYFYPSLNTLSYVPHKQSCPISEDIASRILCLPLYNGLDTATITKICEVLCA